MPIRVLCLLFCLCCVFQLAYAIDSPLGQDSNQAARSGQTIRISEIIIMLRPSMSSPAGQTLTAPQLQRLSAAAQLELTPLSVTRSGGQVLKLPQAMSQVEANNLLQRLRVLPEILWAELQTPTPDKALPQSVLTDPEQGQYTEQIIVKLKDPATQWAAERNQPLNQTIMDQLSRVAGVVLHQVRPMSGGAYVLRLSNRMTVREARAISERLQQDPAVQYAEPVTLMKPQLIPNDPLYPLQWNYYEPAGGINLPAAWDITTGSPGIVVAVIDSGILPHPDLAGRTVPGYDFISDPFSANDGNGRDSDPTDPGDWATVSEAAFLGCSPRPSDWHGTHVAGIIGAIGNNGMGVAGVNWNSKILPVRALGKCGWGSVADISDGISWAAGSPVPGAPPNFNPARVINLSLSSHGTCPAAYQEAINAALMANASVIVIAGNEPVDAASITPANCNGVITVAATRRSGDRTSYSGFGAVVKISAPGGDGPDGPVENGIASTNNDGLTTAAHFFYAYRNGTSFAAPQVAGIAALMLSVNSTLTPAWITYLIQITARPFAPGTFCALYYPACGAGIIDAGAAVAAARRLASTGPQPGWWWNPAQSGRGFSIEVRGNTLFMAGYLYGNDGRATWLLSAGPMTNVSNYSGPLSAFGGGQTLTGPYQPATLTNPNVGTISLQFSDATHGTLTWPGGTMPIERFVFGSGTAGFQPETGWWWNAAEGGRGFAIEIQGNMLFMAGYMYDSSGNPIWYVSAGGMTFSNFYQGSWLQFANGQTLTGPYKPPSQPPTNVGAVTLQFISATTATLALPNGRQIPLTRFLF